MALVQKEGEVGIFRQRQTGHEYQPYGGNGGCTILGISQCVCKREREVSKPRMGVQLFGCTWGGEVPRMTLVCPEGYPAKTERIEGGMASTWLPCQSRVGEEEEERPYTHTENAQWLLQGGSWVLVTGGSLVWGHPGPTLPLQRLWEGGEKNDHPTLPGFLPSQAGAHSGESLGPRAARTEPPSPKSPGAKSSPPVSGALRPPSQLPTGGALHSPHPACGLRPSSPRLDAADRWPPFPAPPWATGGSASQPGQQQKVIIALGELKIAAEERAIYSGVSELCPGGVPQLCPGRSRQERDAGFHGSLRSKGKRAWRWPNALPTAHHCLGQLCALWCVRVPPATELWVAGWAEGSIAMEASSAALATEKVASPELASYRGVCRPPGISPCAGHRINPATSFPA